MFRDRLVSFVEETSGGRHLEEVIVGLGFSLVYLDNGAGGLAYTLREDLERGCDAFAEAGNLGGRELDEVLSWIGGSPTVASSVGLAAANALLQPPEEAFAGDLLAALDLQPGERVVTVGRFRPMEPQLARTGIELEVIARGAPATPLRDCDVALITATSIINNTLDGLLEEMSDAREVVILGPSTPHAPGVFADSPVTLIAGSAIADPEKVRRVVSEGGGTKTMGKALRKWVVRVDRGR